MLTRLQRLLDEHGVQHFTARELLLMRRTGEIGQPPCALLPNILPTVQLADAIRRQWGGPVICRSGYRSPAYNRLVGSDPTSQHVQFRAMDLAPAAGDLDAFVALCARVVATWREEHIVGFGLYDTFVHIDTGRYGHHRTWDYRSKA